MPFSNLAYITQVRKKAQVILPQSVRLALNIQEGDFLDVRVNDGEIVMRVKKLVDKEQAWFWTKRWQEGESEAEDDVSAGRIHRFDGAKEAVAFLHKRVKRGSGITGEAEPAMPIRFTERFVKQFDFPPHQRALRG